MLLCRVSVSPAFYCMPVVIVHGKRYYIMPYLGRQSIMVWISNTVIKINVRLGEAKPKLKELSHVQWHQALINALKGCEQFISGRDAMAFQRKGAEMLLWDTSERQGFCREYSRGYQWPLSNCKSPGNVFCITAYETSNFSSGQIKLRSHSNSRMTYFTSPLLLLWQNSCESSSNKMLRNSITW